MQYLIKWADLGVSKATSEPATNIIDQRLIANYLRAESEMNSISTGSRQNYVLTYILTIFLAITKYAFCTNDTLRPNLGNIYDCSVTRNIGSFVYPKEISCEHSLWANPTFHANILQYHPSIQKFPITFCQAFKIEYECGENFIGQKEKFQPRIIQIKTNPKQCLDTFLTKSSPHGVVTKINNNHWQTKDQTHYTCSWMKDRTKTVWHYTVKIYTAFLEPENPLIHQELTSTTNHY